MNTPTEVRTVLANGISLNVAVAGSGPAVLLLHGFPHTWTVWSEVIPRLAGSHTVIAPDLRGLGDSERTAGGYDAATTVADVVALLDALDVAEADVVGIDLGTPVATLLALTAPRRVRRLVVMEALVGALPGAAASATRSGRRCTGPTGAQRRSAPRSSTTARSRPAPRRSPMPRPTG